MLECSKRRRHARWTAIVLGGLLALAGPPNVGGRRAAAGEPPKLPRVQTPFYWIYSKLDKPVLLEAAARLTAVAREYHRRTRGFKLSVKHRMPVFIFDNEKDYHAAGGPPGSEGYYMNGPILTFWGGRRQGRLWEILQHECFHQFVWQAIGGHWPVWLNEGMATYFEEGIWTGDGFVAGIIPPRRLREVKDMIRNRKLKPFEEIMTMSTPAWNARVGTMYGEYCQVWSMVHFFAHHPDPRYQKVLVAMMKYAAALPDRGWRRKQLEMPRRFFGSSIGKVQEAYEQWWAAVNGGADADRRAQAAVATLASFLARAHLDGRRFRSADEFLQAAREGKLPSAPKGRPRLWLPQRLLQSQLEEAKKLHGWQLRQRGSAPTLIARLGDDLELTGTFALDRSNSLAVNVRTRKPRAADGHGEAQKPTQATVEKPTPKREKTPPRPPVGHAKAAQSKAARRLALARSWLMNHRNDKAREILQSILRKYPDSAAAEQARALLKKLD